MITLEKAIEVLELNLNEAGKKMPPDVKDSLSLGVEAMKRIRRQRSQTIPINQPLLPGERGV